MGVPHWHQQSNSFKVTSTNRGESSQRVERETAVRYPKMIYFNVRSIHGWGILSVPGSAQPMEMWLLSVQKGCGDGCEDKGVGTEFHCMSEHHQPSLFYSLPFPNHFSPEEWYSRKESMFQERRWCISRGCQTLLSNLWRGRQWQGLHSLYRNWNSSLSPLRCGAADWLSAPSRLCNIHLSSLHFTYCMW